MTHFKQIIPPRQGKKIYKMRLPCLRCGDRFTLTHKLQRKCTTCRGLK